MEKNETGNAVIGNRIKGKRIEKKVLKRRMKLSLIQEGEIYLR